MTQKKSTRNLILKALPLTSYSFLAHVGLFDRSSLSARSLLNEINIFTSLLGFFSLLIGYFVQFPDIGLR